MKICIITTVYSSETIGGAYVYAYRIANELAIMGHEIVVIAINQNRRETCEIEGSKKIYKFHPLNVSSFHTIGKKRFIEQGIWTVCDIYNPYSYFKIKKILQKEKPDVVHLHTPIDVTLSVFTALVHLQIPTVFTTHDYLLLCRRIVLLHGSGQICTDKNVNILCKWYRFFTKQIVNRSVDTVIFPTNSIRNNFLSRGFFVRSQHEVLPYGIYLKNAVSAHTHAAKKRDAGFTILYVGSLTKHKGIDTLIHAFHGIDDDTARLLIAGEGIYGQHLKKVAGDDVRISFLGKVLNENIAELYARADVLVVPSQWYEVLGMVSQEAFRAGVPVIGANIGGIPEIVKHEETGLLFEPGNANALQNALLELKNNPEKRKQLGNNGRESIEQYAMDVHMNTLVDVYKSCRRQT